MSKVSVVSEKGTKKGALVPRLRFPEFRDDWRSQPLGELASIIKEKTGNKKCTLMSIMSGVGLISQINKFGKEIAGEQYKNYIVIRNNDFAYNKSATKDYPQGFIALYSGTEIAAVPNSIFTCFKVQAENIVPAYLNCLFLCNFHGRWLKKYITVGARAHGALSIDDEDLLALPVPYPKGVSPSGEQQKIADCLSSLDQRIAAEANKLDALKTHKNGLFKKLFPAEGEILPQLRFPEFREDEAWEEMLIENVAEVTTGNKDTQDKVDGGAYPFFVRSQQVESIDFYALDCEAVLTSGDGVGVGKNFHYIDGKFNFHQRVYCIYNFSENVVGKFVFYCFSEKFYQHVMRLSAKNSVDSVRRAMITELQIAIPFQKEQQRIADCLSSLDELITAQTQKIDLLKSHKKGLMQQLFPVLDEAKA